MQTNDRHPTSTWYRTPFGRLAVASAIRGRRRPSIAEALAEVAER